MEVEVEVEKVVNVVEDVDVVGNQEHTRNKLPV